METKNTCEMCGAKFVPPKNMEVCPLCPKCYDAYYHAAEEQMYRENIQDEGEVM